MKKIYERLADMTRQGSAGVLATVIRTEGSTPRSVGAKMLIARDGRTWGTIGGGAVEAAVIREAAGVVEAGEPRIKAYDLEERIGNESICGGRMEVFLDPLPAAERLYIFGAGHVARALVPMAKAVGFCIIVIDPRSQLADPGRFPTADEIVVEDFVPFAEGMESGPDVYAVVVTPNHEYDEEVVRSVLGKPFRYVGMIGSRQKVATVIAHLREFGFTESQIESLHSPIGLDIGAETPEEIAVSILAELVECRRKGAVGAREGKA